MRSRMTLVVSMTLLLAVLLALPGAWDSACSQTPNPPQKQPTAAKEKPAPPKEKAALAQQKVAPVVTREPVYTELPGYGKKCWIGDSLYFKYHFAEKPKMGTAILRIHLFDKNDAKVTSLVIHGITDMPAMRGAHDSGEVPFQLNKKGAYLLPVNIVMPGEWEVKLIFLEDKKPIFRGRFGFKI